jgi:hypothetical protein
MTDSTSTLMELNSFKQLQAVGLWKGEGVTLSLQVNDTED